MVSNAERAWSRACGWFWSFAPCDNGAFPNPFQTLGDSDITSMSGVAPFELPTCAHALRLKFRRTLSESGQKEMYAVLSQKSDGDGESSKEDIKEGLLLAAKNNLGPGIEQLVQDGCLKGTVEDDVIRQALVAAASCSGLISTRSSDRTACSRRCSETDQMRAFSRSSQRPDPPMSTTSPRSRPMISSLSVVSACAMHTCACACAQVSALDCERVRVRPARRAPADL